MALQGEPIQPVLPEPSRAEVFQPPALAGPLERPPPLPGLLSLPLVPRIDLPLVRQPFGFDEFISPPGIGGVAAPSLREPTL
jgi:hypothetical protein